MLFYISKEFLFILKMWESILPYPVPFISKGLNTNYQNGLAEDQNFKIRDLEFENQDLGLDFLSLGQDQKLEYLGFEC